VVLPNQCRKWVSTQDVRNISIPLKIWPQNNNVLNIFIFYFEIKDISTQIVTNTLQMFVWFTAITDSEIQFSSLSAVACQFEMKGAPVAWLRGM